MKTVVSEHGTTAAATFRQTAAVNNLFGWQVPVRPQYSSCSDDAAAKKQMMIWWLEVIRNAPYLANGVQQFNSMQVESQAEVVEAQRLGPGLGLSK